MRLAVLTALVVLVVGCSHSAAPRIAPQSQPVVPSIIQTGTPPLQWAHIAVAAGSPLSSVARDTRGNIWFSGPGRVGYMTMGRKITQWSAGYPTSLVEGPDGNMWAIDGSTYAIEKITPTGSITAFNLPTPDGQICSGPDGNLWYGTYQAVVKFTTQGVATTIPIFPSSPSDCHKGSDGRVWFAVSGGVAAIDPATSTITIYPHPFGHFLTLGSDGNIWSAAIGLGKITPEGSLTWYPVPISPNPLYLRAGTDGNLWFADSSGYVGEMTTSGIVLYYHRDPYLAAGGIAEAIATGSDGNLYIATWGGYIDVFIRRVLTASPSPVNLTAGAQTTLIVSESNFVNTWNVVSENQNIASVAPTAKWASFTVDGIAHGTTTLTISDKYGNSLVVTVNVN